MTLSVAVIGAGIGGLAVAAALRRIGMQVQVYEQATRFARVGAGIQMNPNAMFVLRELGVEPRLRQVAFAPLSHLSRDSASGEVTNDELMPEDRYGAPYLCLHRAELHSALLSLVPPEVVLLGKKLVGLNHTASAVQLTFADGEHVEADVVIGADGVHSIVREIVLGPDSPIHKGRVAYRAVYPAERLRGLDLGPSRTKWWGPDRHIVIYYTTRTRDEVYFTTSVPEPVEWMTPESWSARGDIQVLREAYAGFHPDVRAVLEACPDCHKWAILEREPLSHWSDGPVVLLGDACHPMPPYMAQGGAMALEDAAVLARCLEDLDIQPALSLYERHRKPRTSRVQATSSANTWGRLAEPDTDWLYAYNAWTVPLEASVPAAWT